MIEKVNSGHPGKLADRSADAIVDLTYAMEPDPKIAVEILIGHGSCNVIIESSAKNDLSPITKIICYIGGDVNANIQQIPQDTHLSQNQREGLCRGDNGIFKGVPLTQEQKQLSEIAHQVYEEYPTDGKYILNGDQPTICQSNAPTEALHAEYPNAEINPPRDWTGGTEIDTGATNLQCGSEMADSISGGGLHGKDLSKADISVNIHAYLKAQRTGQPKQLCCAIYDSEIDGVPHTEIVTESKDYVHPIGGFEELAEGGLF